MSILSSDEVINYLKLSEIDESVQFLWDSIEAFVQRQTVRNFCEKDYSYFENIKEGQTQIGLRDIPVKTFTSLEFVSSRDSEGAVELWTWEKNTYVVDTASGVVHSLVGKFPEGPQICKLTYAAGYSAAELAAGTVSSEINELKLLITTLLVREWGLSKENKRHLKSISFADETSTYQFDLDHLQRRMLLNLKLPRV